MPDVVAVVGLGYVGLPLAVEFGKLLPTIGFDVDSDRIQELRRGQDRTSTVTSGELGGVACLTLTNEGDDIAAANVYVVAVPTPLDSAKRPDFGPLLAACRLVGDVIGLGDLVIFESTVYPGATEERCVPALEKYSGLRFNKDFFVGYSPERINPGDSTHGISTVTKVTSGSTPETAARVAELYGRIVPAGTYPAPSIRVAEAAKVIENTQRDLNIALINELAILFGELGLDTHEVLAAARTKWNFLPFEPGLVGGHCIGVDPYYLTHKAQEIGFHPEVILAGRRTNDAMGAYVAEQVVMMLARAGIKIGGARILVLGFAFKENCSDPRNTRVVDVLDRLGAFGIEADVVDPCVDPEEAKRHFDVDLVSLEHVESATYAAVILAVAHDQFLNLYGEVRNFLIEGGLVYDVKGVWPRESVDARL